VGAVVCPEPVHLMFAGKSHAGPDSDVSEPVTGIYAGFALPGASVT
jgi:hypothetical protein